jgi:NitT/TauT family transport system permease protein
MSLTQLIRPKNSIPTLFSQKRFLPNFYDIYALLIIVMIFCLIAYGAKGMNRPLASLHMAPLDLSLSNLPKYALYTSLRMFAAMFVSLVFTFVYATVAAKYRKAEELMIPVLDVLQSVPVLGFLTFTVTFFVGLFPGYQAGFELAAIFAVFTAQAWNMAFSFYQSLRSIPADLNEVSRNFNLNPWQKYWRLEVPFAMPGLIWNVMMSMSGGWFFVVAAEAISVGSVNVLLPGIGSWLKMAIDNRDLTRIIWAVVTMACVIVTYDQLIFRPILKWADKFNVGQIASRLKPKSIIYDITMKTKLFVLLGIELRNICNKIICIKWFNHFTVPKTVQLEKPLIDKVFDAFWYVVIGALIITSITFLYLYLSNFLTLNHVIHVLYLGILTLSRVIVLVFIASLIWVPIGVWVGLRPGVTAWVQPFAQFLAAFPANILFPIFVVIILNFNLNPNIWLSPLMILGTQWYIFFNVIAGASAFSNDLKEVATIFNLRSWLWWRKVMLPAIFPYYVTGALTATGGSWNASIVAEVVSWGKTTIEAEGLGSYITNATNAGDFKQVVLGVTMMCILVVICNRLFWHRMYLYAEKQTGAN